MYIELRTIYLYNNKGPANNKVEFVHYRTIRCTMRKILGISGRAGFDQLAVTRFTTALCYTLQRWYIYIYRQDKLADGKNEIKKQHATTDRFTRLTVGKYRAMSRTSPNFAANQCFGGGPSTCFLCIPRLNHMVVNYRGPRCSVRRQGGNHGNKITVLGGGILSMKIVRAQGIFRLSSAVSRQSRSLPSVFLSVRRFVIVSGIKRPLYFLKYAAYYTFYSCRIISIDQPKNQTRLVLSRCTNGQSEQIIIGKDDSYNIIINNMRKNIYLISLCRSVSSSVMTEMQSNENRYCKNYYRNAARLRRKGGGAI